MRIELHACKQVLIEIIFGTLDNSFFSSCSPKLWLSIGHLGFGVFIWEDIVSGLNANFSSYFNVCPFS